MPSKCSGSPAKAPYPTETRSTILQRRTTFTTSPSPSSQSRVFSHSGNSPFFKIGGMSKEHSTNTSLDDDNFTFTDQLGEASVETSEMAVYHGVWPSAISPLPSPFLDVRKLGFMQCSDIENNNSVSDEDDDEPLQRHGSTQSLDSEPGINTEDKEVNRDSVLDPTVPNSRSTQSGLLKDVDQVELSARRGRRRAIIDEKNLIGETEVESQDSPSSSTPSSKTREDSVQDTGAMVPSVNVFRERQGRMLRKQHTIADMSSRIQPTIIPQDFDPKRRANVFLKLIERRTRSKESLVDLCDALQRMTPSSFHDHYLESFRHLHWSQLTPATENDSQPKPSMPDREIRRREAVWELFKSELIFFLDHLMVLKNCFMEPLKKLQVDGHLMFVEPANLFGNLDDLCYVSHTLCRELIGNLSRDAANRDFGSTDVLLRPLKRWSEHSKDGEVYHNYCLNYDSALAYLDSLRKAEQFGEFEKWCEQDPRCRRLQLTDLLVAPMQHYMKIPLMLASIRRYTVDPTAKEILSTCLDKVESSLKALEDKMRWLKNFERLQEIQSQLIWPSVTELEPRVFIPEMLRQSLSHQPCERLVANPKRQLLHEGFLTFSDGSKVIEIFAFLFDDFFLITRVKKPPKKKSFSENPLTTRSVTEGGIFIVYRQVLPLDRFTIHDLGLVEANANGLRHAFVLVQITRFQQITGVCTLQAANELDKQIWIEKLRNSQQVFQEKLKTKIYGIDADHRTNKHSKILNFKPKQTVPAAVVDETSQTREPNVTFPSRAASASPSSYPRSLSIAVEEMEKNVSSKKMPESIRHSAAPEASEPRSCDLTSGHSPETSQTGERDLRNSDKPESSKPTFLLPSDPSKIDDGKADFSPVQISTPSSHPLDSLPLEETASKPATKIPADSVSPRDNESREDLPDFWCNIPRQPLFSPPLSPVLHQPCAILPSDVSVINVYDYPTTKYDAEIQRKLLEASLNRKSDSFVPGIIEEPDDRPESSQGDK
ncbi:unnamed protein product [Calicophoron daubneyi]|uniref:DH domain-containing protein n=1 Tax=Calicophoron daubneyi TaxID=300641 RepID=A0AAV2TIQ6_CALDB